MFGDAFVHAFVAAADQQEFVELCVGSGGGLFELAALGGEEHDAAAGIALRTAGEDGFDGFKDGFALQEHAFPAPERSVVDGAMAVVGPVAEVVELDVEEAGFTGSVNDAMVERAAEEVREDGENVEGQGSF